MRKVALRILTVVGSLLVLAVLGVVVRFYVFAPNVRPATTVTAVINPQTIERGRYLANNVAACVPCHSPLQPDKPGDPAVEGMTGAGRDFGVVPGFPGHLRAPNLTPDKGSGIGNVTDGELLRAIREGIGHDGHVLFPQMPYRTYGETLSDDDTLAIVAYLRSLPPRTSDPGKIEIQFPVSMFVRTVPRPVLVGPPSPPPAADKLARGNWLLSVCSCHECHDTRNSRREKIPGRAFAGGMKFPLPRGRGYAVAPNITSDPATGIGSYSDEDLRRVLDEGRGKSGRSLYAMPWSYYRGLTSEDKEALLAALRAVTPLTNVVPPSEIQ